MRLLSAFLFVAALLGTAAVAAPAMAQPVIGQAAPDFSVKAASGNTVSLADLKGKIVVLEWTNHDCPFVIKHYASQNMQGLQKELTAAGDLVWLQVISSAEGKQGFLNAEDAKKQNALRGAAPTDTLLDATGEFGKKYLAKTTPHMFVIAADGTLAYMGAIDDDASTSPEKAKSANNYVRAAVTALRAGQPVATPSTRPYGCSIKYAG